MKLQYELSELKEVDWLAVLQIILPFMVIAALLVVVALFDLYKNRQQRSHVLLWTMVILLFNTMGPILYFVMGRKGGSTS